jgi:DNA-binding transcriptional MocR family regulator
METGKAKEIFKTLKDDIANGKYDAASPMPSERTLMRRFGVARATVASALDELERAGFVRGRRGSGTYPVVKKPVTFAVILPDTEMPFHAAICNGLANCAKNAGGGELLAVMGERRHPFLFRSLRSRENRGRILRAA